MKSLLQVDSAEWMEAVAGQQDFLSSYGSRMPKEMWEEHEKLADRIEEKTAGAAAPIPDYSS
jgi:GTP-dependent phosphoenolpyruvate carboxykinase